MQIVWDNLHEMYSLFSGKSKKCVVNVSSAELAQGEIKFNYMITTYHTWVLWFFVR